MLAKNFAVRAVKILAVAVTALAHTCIAHADDLPSPTQLSVMIEPPGIVTMELSPDGKHVAGLSNATYFPLAYVADVDTGKFGALRLPAGTTRYKFRWPIRVSWITNELLAVDYSTLQAEAVDLQGKLVESLGERFVRRLGTNGDQATALVFSSLSSKTLERVDLRSGQRQRMRVDLPGTLTGGAFDSADRLRAVTVSDTAFWTAKTRISNWYRADEASPWVKLEEVEPGQDYMFPVRVLAEPDQIAVIARHDRDTYAMFRYDVAKRAFVSLMAADGASDITGISGLDEANINGVISSGMKPTKHMFDVRWARLQASVDQALPGRVNHLQGNPEGRLLVFSYGDVDPGRWLLLDAREMTMRELGSVRSGIDPKRMRPMEVVQYKARDGLAINAYLTRPARPAGEKAPMVVLIHGGPSVRDEWKWNEEVQLLASYGYVVFQPQFRGSSGFGRRFEEAGYMQWGLAMQDDITDGVSAMIDKGVADPARICIYGASYGGYAALWGAIKTPDLYRCGISLAGVSDLEAWVSGSIFDDSNRTARDLKRARIGDPAAQREQFAKVSPLLHADRVRIPLLISHGEDDTRVLISHSEKMVSALKKYGKSVEWLPLPNEGHGLEQESNKKMYYTALLSFLQRHIGDHRAPREEQASVSASAPASTAASAASAN